VDPAELVRAIAQCHSARRVVPNTPSIAASIEILSEESQRAS
jgi:hypothetical protein